jgi:hypothetical protein
MAKIRMDTTHMKREYVRDCIVECVARSGVTNGVFRYYMSAGVGNGVPLFYAMVEEGIPVKPINGCKDL